jgi:uncharacterized protein (DUF362 family)
MPVAIVSTGAVAYPESPFHPGRRFPEYRYREISPAPNPVYEGVRECLRQLGLDGRRFGTPDWNPLGRWIRPGMTVLVKPNLVRHFHPLGYSTDSLYTHGSLIRAVCDYALMALCGTGELIIADAPLQTCDFKRVCELSGVTAIGAIYKSWGEPATVRDLRLVRARAQPAVFGHVLIREENCGDPCGYKKIDLGRESLHNGRKASDRYRVTCYDPGAMREHHGDGRHQYIIANTLLQADVVLNLPKMKTHHKAGLTGALKNFVGINGHKDCLPHHVQGSADEGGDEYARRSRWKKLDSWILDEKERHGSVLLKKGAAAAHKLLRAVHMREDGNAFWEGSWHGNDTISRTTIDLNRIVRFADKQGRLQPVSQRTVFTLADGVIAGEKDGPLAPKPRATGLLVAGDNPVAVDLLLARLMGFRWQAIPTLVHAVAGDVQYPLLEGELDRIQAVSNDGAWHGLKPGSEGPSLSFEAHSGWRGRIEL